MLSKLGKIRHRYIELFSYFVEEKKSAAKILVFGDNLYEMPKHII